MYRRPSRTDRDGPPRLSHTLAARDRGVPCPDGIPDRRGFSSGHGSGPGVHNTFARSPDGDDPTGQSLPGDLGLARRGLGDTNGDGRPASLARGLIRDRSGDGLSAVDRRPAFA